MAEIDTPRHLLGWHSPIKGILTEVMTVSHAAPESYLSYYDELIREIGIPLNIDWRLVSAMAYVESRFKPHAVSNMGAIGLMQIMPRIGRSFGIEPIELYDPATNIHTSIRHYRDIERMLRLPRNISERDRMSFILASYNGGIGRVFDAQRLTRYEGGNIHKWSEVVPNLLRLRHEEGYTHEVVRFGSFTTAYYTVRYVRDVLKKYDEYLDRTAECTYHLYPYALRYDD